MGALSPIQWTTHTLNLWWGCLEVSQACVHCYAREAAHFRLPRGWAIVGEGRPVPRVTLHADVSRPEIWGPTAPRIFPPLGGSYVDQPFAWNRRAQEVGERHRVFVMSMGDWAETHRLDEVNRWMAARRAALFTEVIPKCTALDFLLLTKRTHDIGGFVPEKWRAQWPANVWIGCTVEDQTRAEERLPHLLRLNAPVRFISAEPLLGRLDLSPWIGSLDWIIAGGESGARSRPSAIEWVRDLRDQAMGAGVPYFFKQWGNHAQRDGAGNELVKLRSKNNRMLDGREWNDLPIPRKRGR